MLAVVGDDDVDDNDDDARWNAAYHMRNCSDVHVDS